MEDFEESGKLETVDPSVAIIQPSKSDTVDTDAGDSRVHTRTYDLYICYNKYYQTPHIFLIGFDENRKMLTMEQMFEDVSQDNAKKTVTMESHPHLGLSLLAVHPCRHSDLMKKFIQIVSSIFGIFLNDSILIKSFCSITRPRREEMSCPYIHT